MDMEKNTEQVEQTAEETVTEQTHDEREEAGQEEKLFTQDELNAIVQKRLDRERKRLEVLSSDSDTIRKNLIERERAITERELRAEARERLIEAGLPGGFAEIIDCSSEAAYEKALEKTMKQLAEMEKRRIDAEFKAVGRTPQRGSSAPSSDPLRAAFKP